MLQVKRIQEQAELQKAVHIAFENDIHGLKNYLDTDLLIDVQSVEDGIADILLKLHQYEESGINMLYYSVQENAQCIGYFACYYDFNTCKFCLVSFGIAVKKRVKGILSSFFFEMRKAMLKDFFIGLCAKNTRAIKWLVSCGMRIISEGQDNKANKFCVLIS